MVQFRQGDIFIEKVTDIPSGAERDDDGENDIVLATGEATGHAHMIRRRPGIASYSTAENRYLDVSDTALLTHEEHAPILLPAGRYRIVRQREYGPDHSHDVHD